MYRTICCAVAALLALSVASVAAPDEAATCENGWGDDAIAACTRVIERDPTDATAYYNRGVAQKEVDRSESDFEQAMTLGFGREDNRAASGHVAPNAHIFMCGHLGGYYYVIAQCTRLLMLEPKNAGAYNNRGLAYHRNREYDRAIAEYDQAINLDPKLAVVYNNRGKAHYDKGERDRAIDDYGEAIRLDPKLADAYTNRGNAYQDKGERNRASADFSRARRLNPYVGDDAGDAATCEQKLGPVAIAACDSIVARNPNDAEAHNHRGNANYRNFKYDRAIADYDQAIRLNPKLATAYYSRGAAYYRKHDNDRAESDFEQAMKFGFGSEDNRTISGHEAPAVDFALCTDSGYAGIAGCTRSIMLNPKDANIYSFRGTAYFRNGEYDRAIADYGEAIRMQPHADYYAERGDAYSGKGEYERAIADYDQALTLNRNHAGARKSRERAQATLAARPEPAK